MSLEAILAAIQASGEAEVDGLHTETAARVSQVLVEAERTAAVRREAARLEALRPAAAECARRLYRAKLEALRTVGQVREGLVQTTLAEAQQRLVDLRATPDYPVILRRLVDEAIHALAGDQLEGHSCRLEIDARDEVLAQQILADLGVDLTLTPCLNCWGGVVAYSADGRIVASNTLEARLERAMPFLRRDLATLFEQKAQPTLESQPACSLDGITSPS